MLVRIDIEECIGCGACVPTCPEEAITLDDEALVVHLDEERCEGCLDCIEICPVEAIAPLGEDGQPVKKPQPAAEPTPMRADNPPPADPPRWETGSSFEPKPTGAGCEQDEPFSLLSWRPGRGRLRRRLRDRLRGRD